MEKDEIVSNDENLKISSFKNAKKVLINNFNIKNYKTQKECIYDIFGTPLYNSINIKHLNRILYEYFCDKDVIDFSNLNGNIKDFNDFCCKIKNLQIYEEHFDLQKSYEFYVYAKSESFKKFEKDFYAKKFDVSTSTDEVEKVEDFSYENYYFLLKKIANNCGVKNLKKVVLQFYFYLQDLYFDEIIFYRMDYKDVLKFIKDDKNYKILKFSEINPEDIYYCFLENLIKRLEVNENITKLDKRSVEKYNKYCKESKEEGEI